MDNCSSEELESWSQKLKVCGHPTRLKILCLIEGQSACVTELWQCIEQPQPVVSQHLAVLKNKKIVDCQVVGNKRIYSICDPMVKHMVQDFINEKKVKP